MTNKITPATFELYLKARKAELIDLGLKRCQVTHDPSGNIAWIEYYQTGKAYFQYPAGNVRTVVLVRKSNSAIVWG